MIWAHRLIKLTLKTCDVDFGVEFEVFEILCLYVFRESARGRLDYGIEWIERM